jgi:Mg2+-importing ATPase
MPPHALAFWSLSATDVLQQLHATKVGLTGAEARQWLARYGANLLKPRKRSDASTLLLAQCKSPIILILLSATGVSFFLHAPVDACIILTIVLVSGLLGFWQERSATNVMEKLLAIVQITAAVRRDGAPKDMPVEEIVPGDCLVQASTNLIVDEARLTGETFPVEKAVAVLSADEKFGSMKGICADKTGTLTEGRVPVQSALDVEGVPSDAVLLSACLNACY